MPPAAESIMLANLVEKLPISCTCDPNREWHPKWDWVARGGDKALTLNISLNYVLRTEHVVIALGHGYRT